MSQNSVDIALIRGNSFKNESHTKSSSLIVKTNK